MGDLEHDTAVAGGDGHYTAEFSKDWEIWGPNGGYVAAVALRAAGAHSRFDRPATLVGHYLGVAGFDTVDIEVTTLRAAKRAESIRVSITQGEQPIFEALVWGVDEVGGLTHDIVPRPEVPDPESLPTVQERLIARGEDPDAEWRFQFWRNFEERPVQWNDDWENRQPSEPRFGDWLRYIPRSTFDDLWVDACRSLILLDVMVWPAACQLHLQDQWMAPSIDIAAAFHRFQPEEPWLYAYAESTSADGGLVGGDSRVWSRDGTLLATAASQLLCRPAPPRPTP